MNFLDEIVPDIEEIEETVRHSSGSASHVISGTPYRPGLVLVLTLLAVAVVCAAAVTVILLMVRRNRRITAAQQPQPEKDEMH